MVDNNKGKNKLFDWKRGGFLIESIECLIELLLLGN